MPRSSGFPVERGKQKTSEHCCALALLILCNLQLKPATFHFLWGQMSPPHTLHTLWILINRLVRRSAAGIIISKLNFKTLYRRSVFHSQFFHSFIMMPPLVRWHTDTMLSGLNYNNHTVSPTGWMLPLFVPRRDEIWRCVCAHLRMWVSTCMLVRAYISMDE